MDFCVYFADSGDAETAARLAGYKRNPALQGKKLLIRDDIICAIEALVRNRERLMRCIASVGYSRLAFGNPSDAVSLIYSDKPDMDALGNMDLFMISELKRPKDGSLEIKFFDRLKALEKLENMSGAGGVKSFFDAIGSAGGSERDD